MKEYLAIFDLDGTLFDTGPANHAAYDAALRAHGFSMDLQDFLEKYNGRYYKDFLPEIIGEDPALLEQIHREKTACYPQYFPRIRENGPLFTLLRSLRSTHYTALVTTASKPSALAILETFGCTGDFDLILTQAEVKAKKPAPDGFLQAMDHFAIPPARTIIFEDAPEGIAAAAAAGVQCLVVRTIQ